MAVTITQEPSGWIFARSNAIIIAASSTNVANTGFKFVVEVECAGTTRTFLYAPNSSNRLICNVQPIIAPNLGPRIAGNDASHSSIHDLGMSTATLHLNELATTNTTLPVQHVTVTVKEGWIISGVFTPTGTGSDSTSFVVQNIAYPSQRHPFNINSTSLHTTDRNPYTGAKEFDLATKYGLSLFDDIFIPTNVNDRGILSFITDDGTYHDLGVSSYVIRGVMVASDGTTTTKEVTIAGAASQITHFGCYPQNLIQSSIGTGFFSPADFTDYRYYTISLHENVTPGKAIIGNRYVFFDKEYHAKTFLNETSSSEPLLCRVTWLNDQGFWDYFNFNYKCEYTQKTERKRMAKVLGSWSGTSYSSNAYDRGITELNVEAYRTISLTSKKLDTDEFRLISSLLRSTDVYLLTDIGGDFYTSAIIPIVIETTDNIEHRPLDSKAREVTIIAREAHNVI